MNKNHGIIVLLLVIGMLLVISGNATRTDPDEHLKKEYEKAMRSEAEENFLNHTESMKDYSDDKLVRKITWVEDKMKYGDDNLTEGKESLSYVMARYGHLTPTDWGEFVWWVGILVIVLVAVGVIVKAVR